MTNKSRRRRSTATSARLLNWLEQLESRRLLAHIGIDPNFGDAGNAPIGGSMLVAPQPDGKILVATQPGGNTPGYRVARLNADGTLDGSFDDVVVTNGTPQDAIVNGSRVYVVRSILDSNNRQLLQFHAIHLATGGTDTTFGDAGVATITLEPLLAGHVAFGLGVSSLVATPDGGTIVSGTQAMHSVGQPNAFVRADVVYKIDAQGRLDRSFDNDGVLVPPPGQDEGWVFLAAHPGGKFMMINDDFMSRHLGDGSLDTTFGDGGTIFLRHLPPGHNFPVWNHPLVQPDGKILLVLNDGHDNGGSGSIIRLNPDGLTDNTYGEGNGVAPVRAEDSFTDLALDVMGRIVAYGTPSLFRLTPSGQPDPTFDDDGVVHLPEFVGGVFAVDAAGNVLAGDFDRVVRLIERAAIEPGPDGVLRIDGTDGNDTITAARADDQIVVTLNGQVQSFAAADINGFLIDTGLGQDHIDVAVDLDTTVDTHALGCFVRTAGGNDRVTTFNGRNTIQSGAGNDYVIAGGGSDTIDAGAGHDTVFGGYGPKVFDSFNEPDSITGGDGDDKLYGEGGADTIDGGAGNDWLHGGSPHQTVPFDPGDTISGGAGDDWINGGPGDNTIDAGSGDNVLESPYLPGFSLVGGQLRFRGTDGNDDVSVWREFFSLNLWSISVDGMERAFELHPVTEVLFDGWGGNDFLRLHPKLTWAATMNGGKGHDSLFGAAASDDLRGGDGNDQLYGLGGNDQLNGGRGGDLLLGYDGRDQVDYSTRRGRLFVTLNDAMANDGEAGEADLIRDVERIFGGAGDDHITGNDGESLFYGGDGHDTLLGRGGADRLFGEGGNDHLEGGAGDDYIEAGAGHDVLVGNVGFDALFGLAGNDRFFAVDGFRDTVRGGAELDTAATDERDDVLAVELMP